MAIRNFLAASFLTLGVATGSADAQIRVGGGINIEFGRRDHRVEFHERHTPAPRYRVWVPGCWQIVTEQVWVPGECTRVWVPPEYREVRGARGIFRTVCVSPGHYRTQELPGHFETRTRRVWREGCWQ